MRAPLLVSLSLAAVYWHGSEPLVGLDDDRAELPANRLAHDFDAAPQEVDRLDAKSVVIHERPSNLGERVVNSTLDTDLDVSVGHVSISNDKDAARTVRLEEDVPLLGKGAEVFLGSVAGAEAEVRRDLRAGWWHLVLGLVASNECEHLFLARRHGSAIAGLCGLGGAVCRKQGNERRELQGVIGAGRSVTARPPRQSGLRDACALGDFGLRKTAINQAFE